MKELLHTDPELIRLSIPFSQEELSKLESSLMENGCLEPIIIWNGVILDGHKRYKICVDENIEYEIEDMEFQNSIEAAIWICSKRVKQYSKRSAPYLYLIGKWYDYQKRYNFENKKKNGYQSSTDMNTDVPKGNRRVTSLAMGVELGMNHSTVEKYNKVAESIERLDTIEPALYNAILSGEVEFSQNELIRMLSMDNKTISRIRHRYVDRKDIKMRSYGVRKRKHFKNDDLDESDKKITINTGIKEMPAYDPDMAIRGLTLTIPMWIAAIERAQHQTDMTMATENAKLQLGEMLIKLEDKIQEALEDL